MLSRNNVFLGIFFVLIISSCHSHKETPLQDQSFEKLSVEDSLLKTQLPSEISEQNHSMIMDLILGKPKHEIHSIGILVYDGVNDLDFMNPRYVFGQLGVKTQLIALKPGVFKTVMGLEINPNTVIDSITQLDILIIPGGFQGTIEAAYNQKLLDWIKKIHQNTVYTASVCTGSWILGATGLLKGKRASTNWFKADDFMNKYGATYTNKRYTKDGKIWTAAGVTAGIDMSLAIVNDNWGRKYTEGIMLDMEYDPAPPIIGGTPNKTSWLVEWMMNSMYESGVRPLIDSLEKK